MKKLITFFACTLLLTFNLKAADNYTIDDNQVEQLFSNAHLVIPSAAVDMAGIPSTMDLSLPMSTTAVKDKNAAVAFILCFFLGGLGIHRLYMGTKTMTWVGYILTCGGIFGIVPLIDWIMLLIKLVGDGNISEYVDNTKFFMWSK